MRAQIAEKQRELAELTQQLEAQLVEGLVARMQHASWYLTGVQIGLQSLQAYYEISELVYREHTAHSEGGRRLANLKDVYNKLSSFARGGTPQERAKLMLELRQPLQTLLREFRGWEVGDAAMQQRATIISQLANDIRMSLIKLRSFEKMQHDLAGLQSPMYWLGRKAKRKAADRVRHDHIGYAAEFGFDNAEVLMNNRVVADTFRKVKRETNQLEHQMRLVHQKLYRDRFASQATSDLRADLAEGRTVPMLQELSRAGFEYLDRAHSIYEHALQLVKGDLGLLKRVTDLGAEVEEMEFAAKGRRAAAPPPLAR